ncbi:CPXV054 protein, partial [Monkeypox virus]|jgi:hypothetical protein
VYF